MDDVFKAGDRVKFNLGKPSGPVYTGFVVRVTKQGGVVINPERAGMLMPGIQFFNITKVESPSK